VAGETPHFERAALAGGLKPARRVRGSTWKRVDPAQQKAAAMVKFNSAVLEARRRADRVRLWPPLHWGGPAHRKVFSAWTGALVDMAAGSRRSGASADNRAFSAATKVYAPR
jgi:hypothetical protein